MKFFVVLFLAGLAGTLVHGEETTVTQKSESSATASPEASAEKVPEPAADPATTSGQTTLAAKNSAAKITTTQKTKYKITGIPNINDVSSHIKEKIEDIEEKLKNGANQINDLRKLYKKYI